MKQALKDGAALSVGVDHPNYLATIDKTRAGTADSLLKDLVFYNRFSDSSV
jgi:hypothetical protein